MVRWMMVGTALVFSGCALIQGSASGIPLQITVVDSATAQFIPVAKVRHAEEKSLRDVDHTTGQWTDSMVVLPDGSLLEFKKGMQVELEVSAPGYETRAVVHEMRARKNSLIVSLEKIDVGNIEDFEEPVIQFGRDKPID